MTVELAADVDSYEATDKACYISCHNAKACTEPPADPTEKSYADEQDDFFHNGL